MKNKLLSILSLIAVTALCFLLVTSAFAQSKVKITKADDLPRRSIQLHGKAVEILDDDAQLARLSKQLIKNLTDDLSKFDIQDSSTLQNYYATLMLLYAANGNYDKAASYIPLMRELENKQAAKLTTGMFLEVFAKTKRQLADESSAEFKAAFEKNYAEAYAKLPYDVIADSVKSAKADVALQNKELVLGSLESNFQPVLDNNRGLVPENVAGQLISLRFILDHRYPLKEQMLRVLNNLYEANDKSLKRTNVWTEREVNFTDQDKLTPIVAAVWDSGVDISVLPAENRFVNNRETLNGKDDDNNGYVDDVNGIAYDLIKYQKTTGTLDNSAGKIKSEVKVLQKRMKGILDLESSIDSSEAAELQQTIASLKKDQLKDFQEELSFYEGYAHGTHVAGILAAGNPAVKILAARMSGDYHLLPEVPTIEKTQFQAQMYKDTVDYFKKQNVRVVNMSWGSDPQEYEAALAENGVGKNDDERKQMAHQMFEIEKQALYEAIKNAPDILFVCAAGNGNDDASFSEYIPSSFELPNLITIGAVDSEGKKASFTTEGKAVRFYANGFEVESFVPSGDRLKFSGTSMASPNVANLAAKLLVINPKLTPAEIVKLIDAGAEVSTEDPKVKLINPKKTIEMSKK